MEPKRRPWSLRSQGRTSLVHARFPPRQTTQSSGPKRAPLALRCRRTDARSRPAVRSDCWGNCRARGRASTRFKSSCLYLLRRGALPSPLKRSLLFHPVPRPRENPTMARLASIRSWRRYDEPYDRSHSSRPGEDGAMKWLSPLVMLTVLVAAGADRPKMPEVTKTVLFNTPEADRILAALQVFPRTTRGTRTYPRFRCIPTRPR